MIAAFILNSNVVKVTRTVVMIGLKRPACRSPKKATTAAKEMAPRRNGTGNRLGCC